MPHVRWHGFGRETCREWHLVRTARAGGFDLQILLIGFVAHGFANCPRGRHSHESRVIKRKAGCAITSNRVDHNPCTKHGAMAAIKGHEIDLTFRQFPEGPAAKNAKFKICQLSVSNETQRKPKSHLANAKQVGIKSKKLLRAWSIPWYLGGAEVRRDKKDRNE